MADEFKVTFVVGTTASGKSNWALRAAMEEIAKRRPAAIINCDSIQMYQGLIVGSASPSAGDCAKAPHYLYNECHFPFVETAATYRVRAIATLEKLKKQGYARIFIVGGTGFYFQALEKGLFPIAPKSAELQEKLKQILLQENGRDQLYKELCSLDPDAGKRISPNDDYRLLRALDILRTEGKTLTEVAAAHKKVPREISFPYPLVKVGLRKEPEALRDDIATRTKSMLSKGWIEEVETLLNLGQQNWKPLESVGYREVIAYLTKQTFKDVPPARNLLDLETQINQSTWQLARKQRTWFQRDSEIQWIAPT